VINSLQSAQVLASSDEQARLIEALLTWPAAKAG